MSDNTEYSAGAPAGAALVAQAMGGSDASMRYKAMQAVKDWDRTRLALRIFKKCPKFSVIVMGAIAHPVKLSTHECKAFSQFVNCFVIGLRIHRTTKSVCYLTGAAEAEILSNPIFGAVQA